MKDGSSMMSSSHADSEVLGWIGTLDPPQRAEVLATLVAQREKSRRAELEARSDRTRAIVIAIVCTVFMGTVAAAGLARPAGDGRVPGPTNQEGR